MNVLLDKKDVVELKYGNVGLVVMAVMIGFLIIVVQSIYVKMVFALQQPIKQHQETKQTLLLNFYFFSYLLKEINYFY
jgi:hypothetical protein